MLSCSPRPQVLGKMPNKTFTFNTATRQLQPLALPQGTSPQAALERVLRLPSVGSKRFLTTKVDRHVTGEATGYQWVVVEQSWLIGSCGAVSY